MVVKYPYGPRMVVLSVSAVFWFAVLLFWHYSVLFRFTLSVLPFLADTLFRKLCFPFRGPR